MKERHVPAVQTIFSELLCDVRSSGERILSWVDDPTRLAFVAVTEIDGHEKLIGVGRSECLPKELDLVNEDEAVWFNVTIELTKGNLGMLVGSAVIPEYRHQGIASALTKVRLQHLESLGCTAVGSLTWSHDHGETSGSVLKKFALEPVAEATGWPHDEEASFRCPYCLPEHERCQCKIVFYLGPIGDNPIPVVKAR